MGKKDKKRLLMKIRNNNEYMRLATRMMMVNVHSMLAMYR
jgi:hypothetical protein